MKRVLIALTGAALLLAPLGVAYAQNPTTGGVTQADADTACAAVLDEPAPDADLVAGFRAAYNTTSNTDDGPASVGLSADWQRLIYLQELHIDFLGLDGLDDSATFRCDGGTAVFPALTAARDVAAAICDDANGTVEDVTDEALRARVASALEVLGRSFADARADCPPEVTPAPTTTPTAPPATLAPDSDDSDDFDQVGGAGSVPRGGVATGG